MHLVEHLHHFSDEQWVTGLEVLTHLNKRRAIRGLTRIVHAARWGCYFIPGNCGRRRQYLEGSVLGITILQSLGNDNTQASGNFKVKETGPFADVG